jgi:hypothetical protein
MLKKTIITLLFIFIQMEVWSQCTMCKATVESQVKDGTLTMDGINNGIIYLMIAPYLLLLGVGYMLYKNYLKSKNAVADQEG